MNEVSGVLILFGMLVWVSVAVGPWWIGVWLFVTAWLVGKLAQGIFDAVTKGKM